MNVIADQRAGRAAFMKVAALMWLALPANALLYGLMWGRLPQRVASHFDLNGQPNGWASREALVIFSFLVALVVLTTATFILVRVHRPDATAWSLLFLFYVVLGMQLWAEKSVIEYNTTGAPVNVGPVLLATIGAAVLVTAIALTNRRGVDLPVMTAIAQERHASVTMASLMFASAVVACILASTVPAIAARLALGLVAILILMASLMAWSGFQYSFTPAGVEIRTLGFRLRSIPVGDIKSYAIDRWRALGGYGIRGVGDTRAYVWANTGVRIKLSEEEIFLGHTEPERIIRDLESITNHKGHEGIRSI